MLDIVVNKHGYHDHLGIEYEGEKLLGEMEAGASK